MAAVPRTEWEAGLALGVRRGRVVRSIVLRGALPGLVTGNLLAVARAVGETAPLLFTHREPAVQPEPGPTDGGRSPHHLLRRDVALPGRPADRPGERPSSCSSSSWS